MLFLIVGAVCSPEFVEGSTAILIDLTHTYKLSFIGFLKVGLDSTDLLEIRAGQKFVIIRANSWQIKFKTT